MVTYAHTKKWTGFRALGMALVIGIAALTVNAPSSHALMLLDDKVFIGPNASAATLRIKNPTKRTEAYSLDWTELKMMPGGKKQKVAPGETVPGVMPAQNYMYLSPRRLMLMPDQLQHLRLMVRRPADLPPGEYRSYMVFVPEEVPQDFKEGAAQSSQKPGTASVQMDMLTGFRIPVFFLNGETTLRLTATNAGYGQNQEGQKGFYFTLLREGTRSALGDMTIRCMTEDRAVKLGATRIQIFTELNSNDYFIRSQDIPTACATATLEFMPHSGDPDFTGQPVILAEIPLR